MGHNKNRPQTSNYRFSIFARKKIIEIHKQSKMTRQQSKTIVKCCSKVVAQNKLLVWFPSSMRSMVTQSNATTEKQKVLHEAQPWKETLIQLTHWYFWKTVTKMIVNRALKRKIHNNAISYQPNRKQKLKKKKVPSTKK